MKSSKVRLYFSLNIECPHCQSDIDLAENEDDGEYSTPIFTNKWNDLKGELVCCPKCEKEFSIDEVEY
jgi:uncharacterized protein YbaR (Trm112 family)